MSFQTFLIGDRISLRPVEPTDAPIVAACNNDPMVRQSFFTHTPVSEADTEKQIAGYYQDGSDYIPFIISLNNEKTAIGVTAFHRVDHISGAAVFSICISRTEQWEKGFAKDATNLMMEYGFNVLNLHRIQLHVWSGNEAAIKSYQAAGFKNEGTLREAMKHDGKYCDFHVMGLLEDEWRNQN